MPKGGPRGRSTTFWAFFVFIFVFAVLSSGFLFLKNTTTLLPGSYVLPQSSRPINVVLWDVNKKQDRYSSFLGEDLHKHGVVHKKCPFNCTFTTDRSNLHLADAVVFDPTVLHYDEWRRIPISLPHKQPYQLWVMSSYQHQHNYPLTAHPTYTALMDMKMTYQQDSDIPLSLFCPWGTSFTSPSDLLQLSNTKRDKTILFISSNCQFSGASARSAYVTELMKYIPVDSYGKCLNTKEWPGTIKGASTLEDMDTRLALMREYKIVLAFENHNVTDFVTEKVFNAFQAGALPVYMGAPNIEDWLPGPNSVVKTSDFASPQALAAHLRELLDDESKYGEYFTWKKGKISPKLEEKFQRCMYTSECRICERISENITEEKAKLKVILAPERPSSLYQSVRLNGQDDFVKIKHHRQLCVTDRYTLMAWVKPASFGDQRVIDKNRAGTISGYNFDIQAGTAGTQVKQGFPRLCAGEGCYLAKKGIVKDRWSHIAVVYSSEHPSLFQNHIDFYINGALDSSEIVFAPTKQETSFPVTFGNEQSAHNGFHGSMDNVAIFDRDLTESEVRSFMYTIPSGDEKGLVGFWSFDDPLDATYVHDVGPKEYDGELKGGLRELSLEKPLHLGKCH